MKKNKILISITMIFIVLLSTTVLATGTVTGTSSGVQGTGTEEDPYVITSNTTFTAQTVPFYFTVQTPGVYQVNYGQNNNMTFTLLQSGNNNAYISINSGKRKDSANWQLGITTEANVWATSATPAYAINESSYYVTAYPDIERIYPREEYVIKNGKIVNWLSLTEEERYSQDYSTPTFGTLGQEDEIPGDKWYLGGTPIVKREVLLSNATYSQSGYDVSSGDYYYFTNESAGKSLYTSLGYEANSSLFEYLEDTSLLYNKSFMQYGISPSIISVEEPGTLVYQFAGDYDFPEDDGEKGNWIEQQIVKLFMSFGDNFLLKMLRKESILGPDLSIDALIFDEYDKTKLDLYGESGGSSVTEAIKKTVNYWFEAFKILAYVVYMIILVYTGIMIILNAGTGKQDKWKAYLGNWVMGIALLVLVPRYGIPWLFKINTAFVSYIGKGHQPMKTYYNYYDLKASYSGKYPDIMGSDSTTITIEELVILRKQLTEEEDVTITEVKDKIQKIVDKSKKALRKEIEDKNPYVYADYTEAEINAEIDSAIDSKLTSMLEGKYQLNRWVAKGETDEQIEERLVGLYQYYGFSQSATITDIYSQAFENIFLEKEIDANGNEKCVAVKKEYMDLIKEIAEIKRNIGVVDEAMETLKNDLMGMMRAYAGKYGRIVFVFLWYVLFFQLISLVIIYFKRLFMVAILIAIFPLIMMSYAIDKMGDGKSQTLSLWLKELLANVFLQSIHAVIYVVLIEMALEIYAADNNNWMLLMASVFMLIPAEALMKDIFGLNGSTVGKLCGALMGSLTAIGSAAAIARSWKGKKDESVTKKNNARFKKLQKSQDRADKKKAIRDDKLAYAKMNGKGDIREKYNKARDVAYAAGSNVRSAVAKAAPHVDNVARNVKNVAAVTAGTAVAIAGGDVQSIGQGAQIANAITGKGKKLSDDKVDIKSELSSAYKRNKAAKKTSTTSSSGTTTP